MTQLAAAISQLGLIQSMELRGRVDSVRGITVRVTDLAVAIDASVDIQTARGSAIPAQVVGFDSGHALVMPLGPIEGISHGDTVIARHQSQRVVVSPALVGRVIDALGRPIDGKGPIPLATYRPINVRSVECMRRVPIREPIGTGIRSIDAMLTCGLGQRMGIFAGPGVGKSTLLSMIATNTSADISVIALIGERGREVQDFLQHALGEKGLARAVVIVSTADDPPLLRIRAAKVACTISESFRDAGKNVLLLMDSITRLCQAQRQIGLSVGEPPATKGFTPSVFALLPQILERAGRTQCGSITGFYTVLVEGDDFNEPIADAVKGITDGHLWLDRALANRGHFPAVSMLQSISRVRTDVTDAEQKDAVQRTQQLIAAYADLEDLINIGAFAPGGNPQNDLAVRMHDRIMKFLQQKTSEPTTFAQAKVQLLNLMLEIDKEQKAISTAARQAPRTEAKARA